MRPSYVAKVTCNTMCARATWPKLRASSICFETVGHRRWKAQPIKPLSAAERLKMSRIDKRKSFSREMVGRFNTTVRSALTDEVCVSDTKFRWRFSRWFGRWTNSILPYQVSCICITGMTDTEKNIIQILWYGKQQKRSLIASGFIPDCVFYHIRYEQVYRNSFIWNVEAFGGALG